MFEPRADTETGGQLAVLALFQHSPPSRHGDQGAYTHEQTQDTQSQAYY